ncbi:hypothetical protein GWI33_008586 [Rhynchophorus ferrugineus]|uniref:Transposase n=1 Tax=Rhynchophorus ferrugineus TaxID=354439 RepID=A0A834ICM6_RHYFE|nr:hypothetical protein GWI33_008586 [Rhynchophorus ferrugineus]
MFPYKIQLVQKLLPRDSDQRVEYIKTTVFCGIHAGNIIGPYFFENDKGVAITVTAEWYQDMIRNFLVPEMEEQGLEDMRLQQDGATAHTAQIQLQMLQDVMENERAESCIENRGHHLADIIFPSK